MIDFLRNNLGDILVIGIVVALVVGVLVRHHKRKASGQSGCSSCSGCSGCSGCAASASCHPTSHKSDQA
ncbi:MAG: FeoB-associated Cys-rich membrane protein [Eubacteriales bacterium]|nr:FeoB-associated Cys-rich membrane protein [Eubacteriales bacterium]